MIDANLENVIHLFRDGKITQYVLEKEFTNAAANNIPAIVEISDSNHGFVIATIPEKSGKNFSLKYIIDLSAIRSILTAEEIVTIFYGEIRNTQKILSYYAKFLTMRKDMDILPSEGAALFLEMYKISISAIPEKIAEKLRQAGLGLSALKLDDAIERLDRGEKVETVLEELIVKKLIPAEFADAARELSFKSKDTINPEDHTGDKLMRNLSFNHTKEFANTYGTRSSQNIDPDYKPNTNQ